MNKITEQYRVIYDIINNIFIVHKDGAGLQNMEFIIHDWGLHNYEPPKKDLVFLNTASKNNEGFSKRQIKSSIKAWELQNTLIFITVIELKWIIRINQIQEFTV